MNFQFFPKLYSLYTSYPSVVLFETKSNFVQISFHKKIYVKLSTCEGMNTSRKVLLQYLNDVTVEYL